MKIKAWALFLSFHLALVGSARADFEDLGLNARAAGMGGALTSLADDSSSAMINPAGLGYLRRAELGTDYGRFFMGLEDDSNLSVSHLTVGFPIMSMRKIKAKKSRSGPPPRLESPAVNSSTETVTGQPATIPEEMLQGRQSLASLSRKGALAAFYRRFSLAGAYQETTLGLGWGRSISRRWNVGLNVKQLSEKYTQDEYTRVDPVFNYGGTGTVSAFSVDVGAIYNLLPRVFMGLSVLDLNAPKVGLKSAETLPRTQKIGLGYRWNELSVGADWTKRDQEWTLGTGVEKYLKRTPLGLRAGFVFGSGSLADLRLGFGGSLGSARLDYALQYPLSGIEKTVGTHRVSLLFKFGQPPASEADPGSLEQAYLMTREKLLSVEARLKEVEENRDSLEKVLVEESTQRIQERIESARLLARSRARSRDGEPSEKSSAAVPKIKVRTHRVEKGETLQSLAERYYGDRSKWRLIYDENQDNIGRGGALQKGQLLIIPPAEIENLTGVSSPSPTQRSKFSSGSTPVEPVVNPNDKWKRPASAASPSVEAKPARTHAVKAGETLQALAQQYYGSPSEWQKIYTANKDKIIRGVPTVGAELVIP